MYLIPPKKISFKTSKKLLFPQPFFFPAGKIFFYYFLSRAGKKKFPFLLEKLAPLNDIKKIGKNLKKTHSKILR